MSKKETEHPFALVILDGFGYAAPDQLNAVSHANTPNLNFWLHHYPHTILQASGKAVGLPEGYIGNSEVGHVTIGSGRIIEQDLVRINKLISNETLKSHPTINSCFSQLATSGKTLHLMGLLSDAGIHSHISHLYAYIATAIAYNVTSIKIHPFLDGRDVAAQSAVYYLQQLQKKITEIPNSFCTIASITGRFYAMDRDKNWERIKQTYDMLTQPHTLEWTNWNDALDYYYNQNITDEFIPPTPFYAQPLIQDGDGILFFNFRPDRARQLTASFVDPHFDAFAKKNIDLAFFMTPIDFGHVKTQALLKKISVSNTLKEALSAAHKTIFSIAETEKYAHITYFFNGGKEKKLPHETRVLVPSKPVKSYADLPEMSAEQITEKVLESLHTNPCNFYLINYANADMVGHSGNFKATVQAIEFLDKQLAILYNAFVKKYNGTLIITADHGNAENMSSKAHTKNPVLFLVLNKDLKDTSLPLSLHKLSDIAPFILKIMNIEIPNQMLKN